MTRRGWVGVVAGITASAVAGAWGFASGAGAHPKPCRPSLLPTSRRAWVELTDATTGRRVARWPSVAVRDGGAGGVSWMPIELPVEGQWSRVVIVWGFHD